MGEDLGDGMGMQERMQKLRMGLDQTLLEKTWGKTDG